MFTWFCVGKIAGESLFNGTAALNVILSPKSLGLFFVIHTAAKSLPTLALYIGDKLEKPRCIYPSRHNRSGCLEKLHKRNNELR
jgi:hypothetical protein